LELLEVAWQLEEAVVGVWHGKVDPDEPGGEGGGDSCAQRGLPHREPLLPPHLLLLCPPFQKSRDRARRRIEGTRDEIREEKEEEEESFPWLSLSSLSLPFPCYCPLSFPFLPRVAFLGGVYREEERSWNILSPVFDLFVFPFSLF
jgi:hypothetical protein